jgi:hypothetical protein
VYTENEIINIFNTKVKKLEILYKNQLSILNDKIMLTRKQFLTAKNAYELNEENVTKPHSVINKYKQRSALVIIK